MQRQNSEGRPPRLSPEIQSQESMLREWGGTAERALEQMIDDIRAGKLYDDTLVQDFDFLRHLMGRREVIIEAMRAHMSRHRGPGTPGYREL